MVVGPENAGKSSLARYLTAYAIRSGRQPIAINLDPKEGLLTVPGTLSAATFTSILDVEVGWGSSPTNGPTQVPVKLPLVYFLGAETVQENSAVLKPILSRLALSVMNRLQDDTDAKFAGCIIDTSGSLSKGKDDDDLLQHLTSEFQGDSVLLWHWNPLLSRLSERDRNSRLRKALQQPSPPKQWSKD